MSELERLRQENAELQRKCDSLTREKMLRELIDLQMSRAHKPFNKALH